MEYLTVPIKIVKDAVLEYRIVGPSETAPKPAEGYTIDPEPQTFESIPGNFWTEYRIIET